MKINWKLLLSLTGLQILFYGFVIGAFFVSDDFDWLNIAINGEPLWKSFVGNYYGVHGVGGTFRPMVNVFFEITSHVFGMTPHGYHAIQYLFHIFNAYLVYVLARYLFSSYEYKEVVGWFSSIIFLLHPSMAEAVIWIAAIGDPMAVFFYLGSFLLYLRYRDSLQATKDSSISLLKNKFLLLSVGAFILSLLTKEIALTLPFVIVVYEVIILRNFKIWALIRNVGLYVIIALGYFVYRLWAIGLGVGYYAADSLSFDFFRYLRNFIHFDVHTLFFERYRISIAEWLYEYWYLYVFLFLVVLVWLLYEWVNKRHERLLFLALFWLGNIALVVPLGMSVMSDEGERYGYLAGVAVAMLLGWLLVEVFRIKKALGVIFGLFLFGYFAHFLQIQITQWSQSSRISENIYSQIDATSFEGYKKVYFVGMPDQYEGAHLLRNGVPQILELQNKNIPADRIPAFVILDKQNAFAPLYESKEILPDGFHFTTIENEQFITGNATETYPEYKFELWNFDYDTFSSDTLRVQFRGGREFDWARDEIGVWYYEQGILKQISVQ